MAHPDWSPDGQEIVMNSYDLGNIQTTEHGSNIYAVKPDGCAIRQITSSSVDGTMRICAPHWSPDGTQIVVAVATASSDDYRVRNVKPAVVDAAGGEPMLLSSDIDGAAPDLRPTT